MNKKRITIISIEIFAIICVYIFIKSKYIQIIPQCWIYKTTGILCPACGGTRCIINILNGNFKQAFFSHEIFFIGIIYLIIINIIYIININRKNKILTWIYPKYWYSIIFAIILTTFTIMRNLL